MSPRPFQPQWRHEAHISPHQYGARDADQHYSYPPFVSPYPVHNQYHPYYGSPCDVNLQYNRFMMPDQRDVAEAARPNKKSKIEEKKKPSAPGKGLKHFSMKICERVKGMGSTSYNLVADELIKELREDEAKAYQDPAESITVGNGKKKRTKPAQSKYDEKNIRRRVYDALNVLMAMEIIIKDKKMIVWNGLPGERVVKKSDEVDPKKQTKTSTKDEDVKKQSEELLKLKDERARLQASVQRKRDILKELITQDVCFTNLHQRNQAREVVEMTSQSSMQNENIQDGEKIPLPFIVVNTNHKAVIQCEMCPQKTNATFDFTMPFEINDDNEILKRIGMNKMTKEELGRTLPPDLYRYCSGKGLLKDVLQPSSYGYAQA